MRWRLAKNENQDGKRAVEMAGLWKAWKAKSRLPPLSTAPWKSRQGQARFPHFHSSGDEADGKVENQKQVSHFPTAIPFSQDENAGDGRASPSARRRALRAALRVKR